MYTSTTALLVLTASIAPSLVVVAAPVYDPVTIGKPAATFIHARDLAYVDELLDLAARSGDGFPATSVARPMNIVPPILPGDAITIHRDTGDRGKEEKEKGTFREHGRCHHHLRGRLLDETSTKRS